MQIIFMFEIFLKKVCEFVSGLPTLNQARANDDTRQRKLREGSG